MRAIPINVDFTSYGVPQRFCFGRHMPQARRVPTIEQRLLQVLTSVGTLDQLVPSVPAFHFCACNLEVSIPREAGALSHRAASAAIHL